MATPRRLIVTTIDYHTAGEPFRIVSGGDPPNPGETMLEKRRFAQERLDHVRRLLVNEPRGHADMYGGFVTDPVAPGSALGVLFFHNDGFSTACGHGTIALATWAIETGVVEDELVEAREVRASADLRDDGRERTDGLVTDHARLELRADEARV